MEARDCPNCDTPMVVQPNGYCKQCKRVILPSISAAAPQVCADADPCPVATTPVVKNAPVVDSEICIYCHRPVGQCDADCVTQAH